MWSKLYNSLDSPRAPLQCLWHLLGGLGVLRTSKYYKSPSGLWGPPAWTSYFFGPPLQKPQWTSAWTRSAPKSTTTFASFRDGFLQVHLGLLKLSVQPFSGHSRGFCAIVFLPVESPTALFGCSYGRRQKRSTYSLSLLMQNPSPCLK